LTPAKEGEKGRLRLIHRDKRGAKGAYEELAEVVDVGNRKRRRRGRRGRGEAGSKAFEAVLQGGEEFERGDVLRCIVEVWEGSFGPVLFVVAERSAHKTREKEKEDEQHAAPLPYPTRD
jgi:hypothetical protein